MRLPDRSRQPSACVADLDILPVASISDLSRATGASQRALRFYEALGLLQPTRTSRLKRLYSPMQCTLAQEIVLLRSLDISLDHIRRLIDRQRPAAEREDEVRRTVDRIAAGFEFRARTAREALARLETPTLPSVGADRR
ncbi:MAG: MerR family transcriptional regulator [Candidatus Brevundimonas phytovorans]|nr:MerR family transcriptional regulator [Brevundimonas sp.]WEK56730.1 MAG: MerR family transcriptional regulator [Brevundimonas sp.]